VFDLVDELARLAVSFDARHVGWTDHVEQAACLVDDYFFADPAGHQLGHQGVQPAAQPPSPQHPVPAGDPLMGALRMCEPVIGPVSDATRSRCGRDVAPV
jgi:hypothetical protein